MKIRLHFFFSQKKIKFFGKNERDCLLELDQYASEGFFGVGWSKNEI